jgi:hypothetical protein
MQSDLLLSAIKTTLAKTKVEELAAIAAKEIDVKHLIDLTFHEDPQIGFRAAWILENVFVNHPAKFLPNLANFLSRFPTQSNPSCRRHFTKILALITHKKASAEAKTFIQNYDTDSVVATVFEWLIDEKVPVAIKSHCLNILANLTTKHHWIKEELLATIDYLVDKESIAFYAKVKQIRKQLK